jgi:hypothetical protein
MNIILVAGLVLGLVCIEIYVNGRIGIKKSSCSSAMRKVPLASLQERILALYHLLAVSMNA